MAQDENRQLKGTVNSLREELEKTRIGVEERVQRAVSVSEDEVKQLKGTNSLREELERNDIEHQEAMQRATSGAGREPSVEGNSQLAT